MMRCPYCGKRIKENGNVCEHCGKELTLLTKYKGQHVRWKDILQIDTLVAIVTTILMVITLFLPVTTFHGDGGDTEYTLGQSFRAVGEVSNSGGAEAWFYILFLVFTVIFICAWFWGEKSNHYFWIAMSGIIGSWLMCIVSTFFMAEACAYLGFDSLSLNAGFYLWIVALCLQIVSVILYRWRTKVLIRAEE